MVRIRVTCSISGAAFSPAAAERATGLGLEHKLEPGDATEVDRMQGRASFVGRAELPIQEYGQLTDLSTRNAAAIMALARSIEALRRCGASDLVLKADVEYSGQCQFELPSELIRRLADLGIPLAIACFPSDVTEELGSKSLF